MGKKDDSSKKKYIAPVIVTVIFVSISLGMAIFMANLFISGAIPVAFVLIYSGIYIIAAVCVIAALISRIKEIKGGEENDLGNY